LVVEEVEELGILMLDLELQKVEQDHNQHQVLLDLMQVVEMDQIHQELMVQVVLKTLVVVAAADSELVWVLVATVVLA